MGRLASIVRWAATIAVLILLGRALIDQWDAVRALSWHGTLSDVTLAVGFTAAGIFTLPLGLRELLAALDIHAGAYAWRIWLQAFIYKYVPGKVMLVAERIRLSRPLGLSAAQSTVIVLWESIAQLVAGCLLVAIAWPVTGASSSRIAPILVIGLTAGLLGLAAFPSALRALNQIDRIRARLGRLDALPLTPIRLIRLVGVYALAWLWLGVGFYFAARCVASLTSTDLVATVMWYVAAYVFGWVASVAPAGVGLREGVLLIGLGERLSPAEALGAAATGRLLVTVVE
ncbi:MAG: lysylphosphatidylglycerol synthase domain-containing protein, partial [Myxococcota bacterium]